MLSDEQMSNGYPFSLLNDEQMSNKVGVEHQPEQFARENGWLEDFLVSFWDGLFSGAFAVSFRDCNKNTTAQQMALEAECEVSFLLIVFPRLLASIWSHLSNLDHPHFPSANIIPGLACQRASRRTGQDFLRLLLRQVLCSNHPNMVPDLW